MALRERITIPFGRHTKEKIPHCAQIPESPVSEFLFADVRMGWFWLAVRLYVGYEWLNAGLGKLSNQNWVGGEGVALKGFIAGALSKTSGAHPDVQAWYAAFLENVILPNAGWFSYFIVAGEILVGIALIIGLFTGIAAFFGTFMNLNFLMAGAVSINPILIVLQLFLILAWRVAGWYGADRFVLKHLGTPWAPGHLFVDDNCKH